MPFPLEEEKSDMLTAAQSLPCRRKLWKNETEIKKEKKSEK